MNAISALAAVGGEPFSIRQLAALQAAIESGPLGIQVCRTASRLDMHPSTMHRCVDTLLEMGLVAHERSKCDRRQVYYKATESGRELGARLGWGV